MVQYIVNVKWKVFWSHEEEEKEVGIGARFSWRPDAEGETIDVSDYPSAKDLINELPVELAVPKTMNVINGS